MCLVCERIELINNNSNPYFVKELEEMKKNYYQN